MTSDARAALRFSVVICTVDRGKSLGETLDALRLQRYPHFEVIVVAGPSIDDTDDVLADRAADVRVVRNDDRHLSRSRNLGIDAASGDVVAFLDDDSIPEPGWLELLAAAFEDPKLDGAGGFVRAPDGTTFQYRYSVCARTGEAATQGDDPGPEAALAGADPFLYLQGTNASFRRPALAAVHGFDEEIEYFHDETDLCARLIDAGCQLRVVAGADVIHRVYPSRVRDAAGHVTDPFSVVKNQAYFAYRHARVSEPEIEASLERFMERWRSAARTLADQALISGADRDVQLRRIDEGRAAGLLAAQGTEQRARPIRPVDPENFLVYPTLRPTGRRRTVAFVTSEYPPHEIGGIGRFTQDFAIGLAELGWETHVVVPGAQPEATAARLDLEDGAWIHRLPARHKDPRLVGAPAGPALEAAAEAYHALETIDERFGSVDIVSAPLWEAPGLVASIDPSRATVTTLMTSLRTVVDLHPSWPRVDVVRLLDLEAEALRHSRQLHAISAAIRDCVCGQYPRETASTPSVVLHLGVRDRRSAHPRTRTGDGRVRMLFVGRLERRKGVDILLDAAVSVLRRHDHAELLLVGRDTTNTELGRTYREDFTRRYGHDRSLRGRVTFAGAVPERELYQAYADADLFVGPSRYESFGLVHVEAMMMGLAVIAGNSGGSPEVVIDRETGLLIGTDDASALAAALDELVADPDLRAAMGGAGRRRFETHFESRVAAQRTAAAYDEIAARHEPGGATPAELARVLASSIERVAPFNAREARVVAEALLRPEDDDPLAAVRRVWAASDDVFVRELYRVLLRREPDDGGAGFVAQLEQGRHRGAIVRDIAWSEEAERAGWPTDWLGELVEVDGWTQELACALAFTQPLDGRFGQDIVDLLVVNPEERPAARQRVAGSLRSGAGRLHAARDLLAAGFIVRHAPDFAGWDPMLNHFGSPPPGDPPGGAGVAAGAGHRAGLAVRRVAGSVRRLPARARRALGEVSDTNLRTTAIAEAIGQVEAGLRRLHEKPDRTDEVGARVSELLDLVARGHTSTGRTHENILRTLRDISSRAPRGEILADGISAVQQHIDLLAESVTGTQQHVDLLQRKLEALAIDLRERLPTQPEAAQLPCPVVPDPPGYEHRLAEMGREVRVNLGCGEKPVPGYINVDMRKLPDVDVVADVRRLPFEAGSLSEVMSAHLVEHFRQEELRLAMLPYWRSLLREDGTLRIICPNWEATVELLRQGALSWQDFKVLTFGLQDYEGDDHFAMYTPASLTDLLEGAGFEAVNVLVTERMNGACPEMELTARPSAA